MQLRSSSAVVALSAAAALSCLTTPSRLSGQQRHAPSAPEQRARPLERLAAEQIAVLPVQYLTFGDSLGWSAKAGPARDYLAEMDAEIAYALRDRGLDRRWTLAPVVVKQAARNATFSADPHSLAATELRPGVRSDAWQLTEPLASQLRSLVAFTDARYVLFPVELQMMNSGSGARARLHVAVVDARRSQIVWAGDVYGAARRELSPAIAAEVAGRLADLIVVPTP